MRRCSSVRHEGSNRPRRAPSYCAMPLASSINSTRPGGISRDCVNPLPAACALVPSRPRSLPCSRAPWPPSAPSCRGVNVSLREGTTPSQLRRLTAGAVELAIVGTPPSRPSGDHRLEFEPLFEDPLLLAVARGHALARYRTIDLDDLAGEEWIAGSTDASDPLLGVWPSLRWQPHVAFVARDWTAKLGLVAAGLGVTVVPGLAATAVRQDVALVRVRGEPPASRTILLATRAETAPAAHVSAFADALHEAAAEFTLELQRRIQEH